MPACHGPRGPPSPPRGAEHQPAKVHSPHRTKTLALGTGRFMLGMMSSGQNSYFTSNLGLKAHFTAMFFFFKWWRKQTFAFQSSSNKINEKQNPLYGFGEYAGKQVQDQKNLFMVCKRAPGYVKDLWRGIGQSPPRVPPCSARSPSAAKQHRAEDEDGKNTFFLPADCCLVRLCLDAQEHRSKCGF